MATEVPVQFFQTAATVIPVVFLALTFQTGLMEQVRSQAAPAVPRIVLGMLCLAVPGEVVCFQALAAGGGSASQRGVVAADLACLGVFFVLLLMGASALPWIEGLSERGRSRLASAAATLWVVAVLAIVIVATH